jgi:hypothetical protein
VSKLIDPPVMDGLRNEEKQWEDSDEAQPILRWFLKVQYQGIP